MAFNRCPVRRLTEHPANPPKQRTWPATLAPVITILDHGLDLGPVTVLVGEHGSGTSTIIGAIALAHGLSPEGGASGTWHTARSTESVLADHLRVVRDAGTARRSHFLRAETMHGFFTYLEANPSMTRPDIAFHDMSHGESFLELVVDRFRGPGPWGLDEPESALSFSGCLALLGVLEELVTSGRSQVVLSTHSPLLVALPQAQILEVGSWGPRPQKREEVDLVTDWQAFLTSPQRCPEHL